MEWARQRMHAGHPIEAAEHLASAGHAYEAGVCFLKAGEVSRALAQFIQVAARGSQYRAAARTVVRVLGRLGRCDASVAQFFGAFVSEGPRDHSEVPLFLRLARLVD